MNVIALWIVLFFLAAQLCHANKQRLLLAVAGDEDVKIAPESFSRAAEPKEDLAEKAAKQYLQQRELGNLERAKKLGALFAQGLLQHTVIQRAEEYSDYTQQVLLYAYVVNRVIEQRSPNSIVAQTALQLFYQELEHHSPELYRLVSDLAAFSLYILCERSGTATNVCVGEVYARLCGNPQDTTLMQRGAQSYERFYHICGEQLESAQYIQ